MSILNRIGLYNKKDIQETIKAELEKLERWQAETAAAQKYEVPDPSIYANQADMYRLSPDLGTALDILADDVGLSKFNVKRMVGEEERDIPNHSFELLLRTPNPVDSGLEFMRDTVFSYKLNGNAIWWLNRTSEYDTPLEIWSIPYQMIEPIPDERMYLKGYKYYPGFGKEWITLPTWQIVHFKTTNSASRFWGLSPIESLAETLKGNLGMRATKRQQYTERGGSPPDILSFKDWINNDAWDDMKIEMKNAAMRNETMMLRGVGDGGVSWMSRAMSSKDAEYIENLESDMRDVFNRIAPGLLAMLDKSSTEANALAARATYAEKALWKTLETFAQKITSNILPAYGRKLIGEYDDPRVVDRRLELEEQGEFGKVHTVEEVRKKFYGHDPLGDERDKLLVSEIRVKAAGFGENNEETPADFDAGEDTGSDDVALKAAIDDLKSWRRFTLDKGAVKAAGFVSDFIPAGLMTSVKRKLKAAKGREEIIDVFNAAIERLKPKERVDPAILIQSIEQSVKALELSK